jgi:hypothetical protein
LKNETLELAEALIRHRSLAQAYRIVVADMLFGR